MAKILTGSIVTDIRGKLNGHAFRKSASGLVLQKSSLPRSRTFYSANPQLQALKVGAINWNLLDLAGRNFYRQFSVANPLKNVFGTPITLSGRAMAQKLFVNASYVHGSFVDSKDLTNCLENVDLAFDLEKTFTLAFQSEGGSAKLLVRGVAVGGCNPYNSFEHLKRLLVASAIGFTGSVDLSDVLPPDILSVAQTGWLHVQISEINTSGWEGMRQNFTFEAGVPYISQ